MKKAVFALLPIISTFSGSALANEFDEFDPMHEMYMDELTEEEGVPIVLTAARLKQPQSEVPASVTVFTSDQIEAWGVRRLHELMRFVPGMFIGHSEGLNNPVTIYHSGDSEVMRRMQVLVDGRSVYESAIADVVWEDIPLAMEDVDRVEVLRGPNGAAYGANAFVAVINVISKHPVDTLHQRVLVRKGNNNTQDVQLSTAHSFDKTAFRITAQATKEGGFDGCPYIKDDDNCTEDKSKDADGQQAERGKDNYRDSRDYHFINSYITHDFDENSRLDLTLSYKKGHTELRQEDNFLSPPDIDSEVFSLSTKYSVEFSESHKAQLLFSWNQDNTKQSFLAQVPVASFDPAFKAVYANNPLWGRKLIESILYPLLDGKDSTKSQVEGITTAIASNLPYEQIASFFISSSSKQVREIAETLKSQRDIELARQAILKLSSTASIDEIQSNFSQLVRARVNQNLDQTKTEIEYQDTMVWSDQLISVVGAGIRYDDVYSDAYFNGRITNELYRTFFNVQYRPQPDWLVTLASTFEYEQENGSHFSPRGAINYMIDSQQSIRAVVTQAFRTPDLLEKSPDYTYRIDNLRVNQADGSQGEIGDNYLGIENGEYFAFLTDDIKKNLKSEKIISYELGYYLDRSFIEMDVKVFYERLYDLASSNITLYSQDVTNDGNVNIDGIELQMKLPLDKHHYIWWTSSYINAVSDWQNLSEEKEAVAQTAENSNVVSFVSSYDTWTTSITSLSNFTYREDKNQEFNRLQLAMAKSFEFRDVTLKLSAWNEYNFRTDSNISNNNHTSSNENLFYLGVAAEF